MKSVAAEIANANSSARFNERSFVDKFRSWKMPSESGTPVIDGYYTAKPIPKVVLPGVILILESRVSNNNLKIRSAESRVALYNAFKRSYDIVKPVATYSLQSGIV